MTSSRELEKKRKSYRSILGIVKAMKALSAANIRKGAAALVNTRRYHDLVDGAAAAALSMPGVSLIPSGGRKLLVAFGSQYGLCGAFNERVLNEAGDAMARMREVAGLVLVGRRLSDRAPDFPLPVSRIDAPGSVEGIGEAISALLSLVYDKYRGGEFDEIYFIFPRFADEALTILMLKVMPPEFRADCLPRGETPLAYITPREMMEGIIEEHLYISLYATALETIIAENETRMRSMDYAAKNIKKRVDGLTQSVNYALQEEVTGELLEIISGYEALRKSRRG